MSDESRASEDGIELTGEERLSIVEYNELWRDSTYYELLGVPADADRKTVRDAYFALSKRFHPDVYFKREIGPYREQVEAIFRAVTRAYDVLGNGKQRAQYDQLLKKEGVAPVVQKSPPIPAPPPKVTPPTGLREAAQAARAIAAAQTQGVATATAGSGASSSGSQFVALAATQSAQPATSTPPPRGSFPDGAVVPPSLRTMTEGTARRPTPPSMSSAVGSTPPVVDDAVRQRALEAMARRLGASTRRPATASSSAPPVHSPQAVIDDRAARVAALISKAEECQKKNDFASALEAYKAALQFSKDDVNLKARIDAVTLLSRSAQVSDHIEKAKQAARDRDPEGAANHWEKAWESRREDLSLLLNAAEGLSRTKEHKRAAELAQRVVAIDPKNTKAHAILAMVFTAAGLRASARSAIEHLAKLEPSHPQLKELREKLGPMTIAEQFGLRGPR